MLADNITKVIESWWQEVMVHEELSKYLTYLKMVLPSYVEYNWVETSSAEPIKSNDHLSRIQLCRMAKSAESTCAESS